MLLSCLSEMKADIHPQVFKDAKATCTSCKAVFTIPSTKKDIQIEICSNCHPVYTGKYRGVRSSGRVERFQKKMASAQKAKTEAKPKKRKLTDEEKVEKKVKKAKEAKKASPKKPASAKATAGKKKESS